MTIYIFSKLFYKWNLLDNPKKYGKTRKPVPYSMGIVFFVVFFVMSYFFIDFEYKLLLLWIFGGIITGVSFLDDRYQVSPKIRLLIQMFIGGIIGLTAIKVGYVSNIFGGILDLNSIFLQIFEYKIYIISLVFTIIWYVFIFNALNWTDGIPGNTSGLSLVSFFIIFLLGVKLSYSDDYVGGVENAKFILSITSILIGILIPFFVFDVKEKILMGDTGTMFLAFMLASIAIISGGKIATVLLVFGLYSIDAIYVIIKRIIDKKSPLMGDRSHLHHRLLDLGMRHFQILFIIFLSSFFFGISSLFLEKTGKIIVFFIIFLYVIYLPKIFSHKKKNEK